ncbi:unnamed protein product, partial [Symbiodinium necroappetens]
HRQGRPGTTVGFESRKEINTACPSVLRRGGLRNGPKVNPQEVDGRVAQLRAQAKEVKAKDKAGWTVPEDYQGPVTQLEHELGNLAEGPDYTWHQQVRQDTEVTSVQAGADEAQKRKAVYEKLLASKKLEPLSGCSDYLHSHVASHFVNAEMQGRSIQLSEVLNQAIDYGHPQLAEEAQEVLGSIGAKAGLTLPEPQACFSTFIWEEGVGKGQMTFNHPLWEGVPPLSILDAQDRLALPEDLGVALQLNGEKAEETRQCLCLHVALAFEPDLSAAWDKARDLRRELWEDSSAAFQHLGDASPYISTAEAFVRHNAHDCIYPHHEKDFRVLQLFARPFMQGRLLVVLRLSHQGVVEVDTIKGTGALEVHAAVVIHRGHMRTARCSSDQIKQLLEIAMQGERVVRELEVEGWGSFLEAQAGIEEDDAGDPARPSIEIGLCGAITGCTQWQASMAHLGREQADLLFSIAWAYSPSGPQHQSDMVVRLGVSPPCPKQGPHYQMPLANRPSYSLRLPTLPPWGGGGSLPKRAKTEGERVGKALYEKASEYLDLCRSDFSVEKAQQAGRLGAELISSAGIVENAVHVLNTSRVQKLGDHLSGARRSAFKGISALHQEYLQTCAYEGVPSRREQPLIREEAKNHGSVYGYEEELLQKALKDAAYGAALFVDPEVGKVSQLLDQAGVAESSHFGGERHIRGQKCAKRDVPRAFKWHFLRAKDVPEFAVKLAGLIILSLAMPFGWVGSPGEFVAWSSAARAHHGSFRPADPKFNDVVPFESKWLMDDGVVVEPMVGNRVFDFVAVLDETMQLAWGPEGVNVEKMAEEGEPSTTQLLWGLHMNLDTQEVRLPEPKRIKAKYLLGETALQRGCREVSRWSKSTTNTLVQVEAANADEEERRWEDFWDALDFIRLQLEAPLQCSFVSVFEKLLPIRERLALPGVTARARITGGDATLERIGAVDWKAKVFHAEYVDRYREGLRNLAEEGGETDIISVMEFLAFVVLACHRRNEWFGELVLYVTDNMNVRTWLHKRRPRNRAASLLVRLVQRLESENHFTVHPIYIRTYRNQLADWLSREDLPVVREQLAAEGWTEVATGLQWEDFLRDAERSALVYPTGDDPRGQVARQLTHPAEPAPKPLKHVCLRVPWQPLHVEDHPEITSCGNQPYAWYTFSQDPSGRERRRLERVLAENSARLKKLVVDCPRQINTFQLEQTLKAYFPHVETCQYVSSHLGAITARRRTLSFCWRDVSPPPVHLGQYRANPPPSMQMIPLDSGSGSEVHRIPGVLTQEPGIVTTGVSGPACAFVGPTKDIKGPGVTLIPSGAGAVRRLSLGEIARAQGLTANQWKELTSALAQDEATRRILQEPGWQVPAAVFGLWQDEPLKAGNCLDPDEETARQQLEVWLKAWKSNPERPRDMLDLLSACVQQGPTLEPTLWPDSGDTRVGGRSASIRDAEDRKLVTPVLLGEERDRFFVSVGLPDENLLHQLDQTGQEAVLSKLADSTRRSYGAGWKQWATFMSGTGTSPFLHGETRAEKQADEEWLIRIVVFLHQRMGRTAQGIKQRLSGIRYAHIAAGYPDPLAGRVRLWAALAGMHRWDGAPVRKVPVTPRMLVWLRTYLQGSNRPAEEKAAMWASICLGWFYMLRASEYLPGTDALNAPARVLRGSDIDFFREGKKCRVSVADSLVVQLRDSKGDQFGRSVLSPLLLGIPPTLPLTLVAEVPKTFVPKTKNSTAVTTRIGAPQKGRNVWEDPHGNVWEEVSDMSDVSEGDFESDGSAANVAITSTGEKASASGADGCALTAAGGGSVSLALEKAPKGRAKEQVVPTVGEPGPGLLDLGVTALEPILQEQVHPPIPRPRTRRRFPELEISGDAPSGLQGSANGKGKAIVSTDFYSFGICTSTATEAIQSTASWGVPPFYRASSHQGNVHAQATHWICPHCKDEVSVKRSVCECGKWRPKSAPLINHGQAAEDRFVAKGATAAPVILNRREAVNQGSGMGLEAPHTEGSHPNPDVGPIDIVDDQEAVAEVGEEEMGVTPSAADEGMDPAQTGLAAMEVDEPEPVPTYIPPTAKSSGIPAKAYPGQIVWRPPQPESPVMSTTSRGPMGETGPLAIVVPNGEALWFTTRDIDADTPRLVIPWSLFQYLAMSRRSLSGFQSWGRVGVVYIRRVVQDIIHGAQQRGFMDRIQEASRTNPLLMDLQSAHPEPQDAVTPMSATTETYRPNFNFRDFLQRPSFGEHFHPGEGPPRLGRGSIPCIYDQPTHEMPLAASVGEADHASNCMGMWARRLLGQENPSPPSKGAPPKATSGTTSTAPTTEPTAPTAEPAPEEAEEEEDSDVELTAEERAEVARIEEECSELERRMRNLSVTQQRSLLENLANASSAVIGGLLADTVRRTAQMRGKGAKGSGRPKVKANQASANKDPKYLEDLNKGLSHTEAFIRHRSRLRPIQHQMEYGDVSLQPRATQLQTDRPLPPMLSLG